MVRSGFGVLMALPALAALIAAPVPPAGDQPSPREMQARREAIDLLRQRAADPKTEVREVWKLWHSFRRYAGTPEYVEAAEVMSRLPSPLDQLKPVPKGPVEKDEKSGVELVAVLGDERGRQWWRDVEIVISADGKFVASADHGCVRVWEAASMRHHCTVKLQDDFDRYGIARCTALALNGKGTLLAAAYGDKILISALSPAFPSPPGRKVILLKGHSGDVDSLVFAPDGKTLISSGCRHDSFYNPYDPRPNHGEKLTPDAAEVIWWDVSEDCASCRHLRTLHRDAKVLANGTLALNAAWVIEGMPPDQPTESRLWRVKPTGLAQPIILKDARPPFAFSPDGKQMASESVKNGLTLWDLTADPPKKTRQFGALPANNLGLGLAFSPDSSLLASTLKYFDTQDLLLWPLTDKAREFLGMKEGEVHRELPLGMKAGRLAFFPDGKAIAVSGSDARIQVRELPTGRERFPPWGHRTAIDAVAVCPDCCGLLSGARNGDVIRWDLSGGRVQHKLLLRKEQLWAPDDPSRGWTLYGSMFRKIEYSPDGNSLLLGLWSDKDSDQLQVWELERSAAAAKRLNKVCIENMTGFILNARGDRLVALGWEEDKWEDELGRLFPSPLVRLFGWVEGKLHRRGEVRPEPHQTVDQIDYASLSPDGKLLAIDVARQSIQVWDVSSRAPRHVACIKPQRPNEKVCGPSAFTLDGQSLITTSQETTAAPPGSFHGLVVRFWGLRGDVLVESRVLKEPGWDSPVSIAVSPDSKLLAVQDTASHVALWRMGTGEKLWSHRFPGRCFLQFAPDSRHVITGNYNGTLYVLRLLPPPGGQP
jgi:WD40 repeat protein